MHELSRRLVDDLLAARPSSCRPCPAPRSFDPSIPRSWRGLALESSKLRMSPGQEPGRRRR
eukprot:12632760-Heterocapsa_arctica.AAC.1